VIEFVKEWLEDFSVSRETNKFGIPLPFDPDQVTYVWYDALFNYLTVCQWEEEKWWPADLHVIWKDIVRFHAIYWPAMSGLLA
jgi:methionyl-tRNA synthetase